MYSQLPSGVPEPTTVPVNLLEHGYGSMTTPSGEEAPLAVSPANKAATRH